MWLIRYLCVERGEKIQPDRFYSWLQKRNQQWFGCGWGANEFRQGMITLGHEFISSNESFPCVDRLLAEAADHSTEVDASHYAVIHGALPRLSNNVLSQHRWLSEEWSSLLGLGPYPIPEPVRAIRTRARSADSLDPSLLALKVASLVGDTIMRKLGDIGITPDLIANFKLAQRQPAEVVPSHRRSGDNASSLVHPVPCFSGWDAAPLTPMATIHSRKSSISTYPVDSHDNFHIFEATPAPRTSQPLTAYEIHSPGRHKRLAVAISCTQESMRPKKRIRHSSTFGSASTEVWKSASGSSAQVADGDSDSIKDWDDFNDEVYAEDFMEDLPHHDFPPTITDSWENTPVRSASYEDPRCEMLVTCNIQPIPLVEDETLRDNIRGAMKVLLGNPAAREKSEAQMVGILIVMKGRQDAMITMRTGGGKSMLWQVPVLLNSELRFIVVCPFTVLLEEQYKRAKRAKINAIDYGLVRLIPPETQILFVQVEHVGSQLFTE